MSLTPMDVAAEVIAELRATIAERDAEIRRLQAVILAGRGVQKRSFDIERSFFFLHQLGAEGVPIADVASEAGVHATQVVQAAGAAARRILRSRSTPPDMAALMIDADGRIGGTRGRTPDWRKQDALLEAELVSGPRLKAGNHGAACRAAIRRLWSMQHPEEARARGWPTCYPGEEGGA